MTISSLDELKTEIVDDLARSDVTTASSVLSRFVKQTERYLNKRLRVREMLKQADLKVNAALVSLPRDFLEIKNIEFSDSPQNIDILPEDIFKRTYLGSTVDRPRGCAVVYSEARGHQLRFGPSPAGELIANLSYYAEIPTLNENTRGNVMLDEYPDLYVNGCLYFAFKKYRNFDTSDRYKAYLDQDIDVLNASKQAQTLTSGARTRPTGTIV